MRIDAHGVGFSASLDSLINIDADQTHNGVLYAAAAFTPRAEHVHASVCFQI